MNKKTVDSLIEENKRILFNGLLDPDLPPIGIDANIVEILCGLVDSLLSDYAEYYCEEHDFITGFCGYTSPKYVYNDGTESISYFNYKNNNTLREMQIPNLVLYCAFVYNTIKYYQPLYRELYLSDKYLDVINHSTSYLLLGNEFYNPADRYNDIPITGRFSAKNIRRLSNVTFNSNQIRNLRNQKLFIYSLKIDIESFYANIYSHLLGQLKNEPFFEEFKCDEYFDFLDTFNMKINDNQTKGIVTGPFSSAISSELLLTAIDSKIIDLIKDSVGYVRYVDDMSFFADSKQKLEELLPKIQFILNDYRLRINAGKTSISNIVNYQHRTDLARLYEKFPFLDEKFENVYNFSIENLLSLKNYIEYLISIDDKAEARTVLTKLYTALSRDIIKADDEVFSFLINTLIQVACTDNRLASRAYRTVNEAIRKMDKEKVDNIISDIKEKNEYINKFCWDTIVQFWHYYVLRTYDRKYDCNSYMQELEDYGNDISPILCCILSNIGQDSNKTIIKYIVKNYSSSIDACDEYEWQSSIMWSKWWLPLFVVGVHDGKDYYSFYSSNNYPSIFRRVGENTREAVTTGE